MTFGKDPRTYDLAARIRKAIVEGQKGGVINPDLEPSVVVHGIFGMLNWMFRWFQRVPFMSKPIATWTEGDRTIEEMRAMVERAHDSIRAGDVQSPAVQAMLLQSPSFNDSLTRLTSEFSAQLGEASRTTQRLLLGLNICIAVLLMISGLGFVRRTIRMQASSDLRMERLIQARASSGLFQDLRRRSC